MTTTSYGVGYYGPGLYGYGVGPPVDPIVPDIPVAEYTVLVTDRFLTVVGDPVYCWTSLDITLRFNEPSSGILVCPAYAWVRDMISPGNRIVIIRNGKIVISGPWETRNHERSDDGDNSGVGKLTVHFADDLASVVGRQVYTDPALPAASQPTSSWTYTGNAEDALRDLVDKQAGPNALTARRVPQLVLGTKHSVGSSVTVTAQRLQPLGDLAREIAEVGGGLMFRTAQVGTTVEFQVTEPEDRSNTVRFSLDLGNVKYISHELVAPTATTAIVGGQGDGADKALIERTNTADETSWGRVETLVSRPGGDALQELQDDGDRALAEGAGTNRLTTNVSDIPDQRYGYHYDLGDMVAVEPWPGEQVIDIVRTVHLQVYATSGEYVAATIGNQAAQTDPMWVRRMRAIDERLGRVERRVLPASA